MVAANDTQSSFENSYNTTLVSNENDNSKIDQYSQTGPLLDSAENQKLDD